MFCVTFFATIIQNVDNFFCWPPSATSLRKPTPDDYLHFRLTIGFKKIDGQWWFMHGAPFVARCVTKNSGNNNNTGVVGLVSYCATVG